MSLGGMKNVLSSQMPFRFKSIKAESSFFDHHKGANVIPLYYLFPILLIRYHPMCLLSFPLGHNHHRQELEILFPFVL